jgi:mRNA interferase RelE/StbE
VKIVYHPETVRYLRHCHPTLKSALKTAIQSLKENPYLGKPLSDDLEGMRSLRYKRYRVIYEYDAKRERVAVLFAGHRSTVYDELNRNLKKFKTRT